MKKYMFILLTFGILIGRADMTMSQALIYTQGITINYDTSGTFALTTLTGAKGPIKRVGVIDMNDGRIFADSVSLWVTFSDSVQAAFLLLPSSPVKRPTPQDTLGRTTPAAAHLWHIQNGAGHVAIPWFRFRAIGNVTDLYTPAAQYEVWVRISKVSGLHTYGTASAGKAAGKMTIRAIRQF